MILPKIINVIPTIFWIVIFVEKFSFKLNPIFWSIKAKAKTNNGKNDPTASTFVMLIYVKAIRERIEPPTSKDLETKVFKRNLFSEAVFIIFLIFPLKNMTGIYVKITKIQTLK